MSDIDLIIWLERLQYQAFKIVQTLIFFLTLLQLLRQHFQREQPLLKWPKSLGTVAHPWEQAPIVGALPTDYSQGGTHDSNAKT